VPIWELIFHQSTVAIFPNAPKFYFWDHPPGTFDSVVNCPTYPASISIFDGEGNNPLEGPNNEKKKCHMPIVMGQCKKRWLTLSLFFFYTKNIC